MDLDAPAKINLFLHVVGKRPDGYHSLVTLFHRLSLCDRVHLAETGRKEILVRCPEGGAPEGPDNLAYKASALFLERAGIRAGVAVTLHKRIPAAAGLGGGSSDAAAVLLGLNRLFHSPLDRRQLLEMGGTLGADVPFFLWEVTSAVGLGRGDEIEPVLVPTGWYVLVHPGIPVSTAWVYANLNLKLTRQQNVSIKSALNQSSFKIERYLHNDLERVTCERYPVIAEIKKKLTMLGSTGTLMSGSGPTVFGYFADREKAYDAYGALQRESTYRCFFCGSL